MTQDRPPAGLQYRDRQWFEQLFREHHLHVLAYARRRVEAEADDVVSEVFATAWQRRDAVPDDPLPWLYRTAANHIRHAHRGSARRARTAAALVAAEPPPDGADFAAGADEKDLILRVLRDLSERDQEILRLWAWEQFDPGRIADVLGCSSATARVRLHRAQRRLRARLNAADPDPTPATATYRTGPMTPLTIKD
jgi:RNA polymerase sigma-70 factor (ECF subfamily)